MTKVSREPSAGDVRRHLATPGRSCARGVSLFIIDTAMYITGVFVAIRAHDVMLALCGSVMAGLFVALLFIVAHDACHGSLTPYRKANRAIGTLCFLPSLYPYSSWELGHNRLHHGWTNFRDRDYVWRPFDPCEFAVLPWWRRSLERVYRSVPGVALYNAIEIWWKHMVFPGRPDRQQLRPYENGADRVAVFAFACLLATTAWWAGADPVRAVLFAAAIPWAIFNWLSGFVIFQHHTHEEVAWYGVRDEWSFFRAQVRSAVHVRFPRLVGLLFHNIMEHGAHHANPHIPLYDLESAQSTLESVFAGSVVRVNWTLADFRRQLRVCRLYDYQEHCWCDFDGTPTSTRHVPKVLWHDSLAATHALR